MVSILRAKTTLNPKSFLILALILVAMVVSLASIKTDEPVVLTDIDKIRGLNAYNNQQYGFAQLYLLSHLDQKSSDPQLHYRLGKSYMFGDFKNINKAIHHYKIFLEFFQDSSLLNAEMINSIKAVGMHESLYGLIEKVNDNFLKSLIMMEKDQQSALLILKQIPLGDRKKGYYKLAAQLSFSLKKFDESIEFSSKAIDLGALNKNLFYQRSQALRRKQKYEDAEKAIAVFELLELLDSSFYLDDKIEALSSFLSSNIKSVPRHGLLVKLIELLIESNNISAALNTLKMINLNSIDNHQKLKLLIESNKLNSKEIFNVVAATVDDANNNIGYATVFCEYYNKNEQDLAESFCKKAVKVFPQNAPLNYWYSITLLNRGDLLKAVKYMQLAVEYAPWMNVWRTQLVQLYLTNGDYDMAKDTIDAAVVKDAHIMQFKSKNGL